MIYWYQNKKGNNSGKSKIKKFLENYKIDYKIISTEFLTKKEMKKIISLDETIYDKTVFLNQKIRNKVKTDVAFEVVLNDSDNYCHNILVDYDKSKVSCGYTDEIRKFVPQEYRRKEMDLLLKRAKELGL